MTLGEREIELEQLRVEGKLTWVEWANLWLDANNDEETYPDE